MLYFMVFNKAIASLLQPTCNVIIHALQAEQVVFDKRGVRPLRRLNTRFLADAGGPPFHPQRRWRRRRRRRRISWSWASLRS